VSTHYANRSPKGGVSHRFLGSILQHNNLYGNGERPLPVSVHTKCIWTEARYSINWPLSLQDR